MEKSISVRINSKQICLDVYVKEHRFMSNKVLILVIDGCAPEYITPEYAPNIHRLARQFGFAKTVKAVVPTVTNVNHASIL